MRLKSPIINHFSSFGGGICNSFIQESSLVGISGGAINVGELEGGATGSDTDVSGDQMSPNMNVCEGHIVLIPEEQNSPPSSRCWSVSERTELIAPDVSRSLMINVVKLCLLQTGNVAGGAGEHVVYRVFASLII